jgi:GDSL-like Lipase/Acylhydrolase family
VNSRPKAKKLKSISVTLNYTFNMKAAFFAMALVFVVGCGGNVQQAPSSSIPRSGVVFVGDSIFGRLVTNNAFTSTGYVDGGMFGYRTDQILALLPQVLSGNQVCHGLAGDDEFPLSCATIPPPKTIVILAGWNNLLQGVPGRTPAEDLKQMISMAQSQGVKVVICTLYAYDPGHPASWMVPTGSSPVTFYDVWRNPLNDGIRLMSNANISIVDLRGVFAGQSFYTIDGIHPTDSGNMQMMNAIMPHISE